MTVFGKNYKWNSLGVQVKLHILIQCTLIILFFIFVGWVINEFENQITATGEARAVETADGLINGMNMMMLTGAISNPSNRQLLLKKSSLSKGIKELRIIRAKQVSDQFGPGLPEEQAVDDIDREVVSSGTSRFQRFTAENGTPMLRVVVPFIALENFRSTNCLSCHHVKAGSVNGAASVVIDLTDEESNLAQIKRLIWLGQLVFQILLLIVISFFVRILIVRNITRPVNELQTAMAEIRRDMDLSKRVDIDLHNADIGEMAKTFNALVGNLQRANERLELFAKLFDNSGEGIIMTDARRKIVATNPSFEKITGYSAEEVKGKNPKILSSGRQNSRFYEEMWQCINETGYWQGEIWNRRKSGEIYPVWLSIGVVKNEKGVVINYISLFTDITKRKESEQQIEFLAHYDSLTKLPNRSLFSDRLLHALTSAKRSGKRVALLFLDLDRFKNINDSLGHLAGDSLLQSVATRLKSCVREMDTVCRQGGDEFMVLLSEIDNAEDAAHVAMKIVKAMSEEHLIGESRLIVTFSIGISIYPDDAVDDQAMIKNADDAMYRAKEKGRNNFQFYTKAMGNMSRA